MDSEIDMPYTQAKMGDIVPNFTGITTEGNIDLHKWLGNSWGILFSYPKPFYPICTTEVGSFAKAYPEFKKRNVKLLGISCEDVTILNTWADDIRVYYKLPEFPITLFADEDRKVAFQYGLLEPSFRDEFSGMAYPCRAMFIIDPNKVLKYMSFHPWSMGRSTDEALRCIDSLQLTSRFHQMVGTPSDWHNESAVMVRCDVTEEELANAFPSGSVTIQGKTVSRASWICIPSGKGYMRTIGAVPPSSDLPTINTTQTVES